MKSPNLPLSPPPTPSANSLTSFQPQYYDQTQYPIRNEFADVRNALHVFNLPNNYNSLSPSNQLKALETLKKNII